jgi:hypothetical protein
MIKTTKCVFIGKDAGADILEGDNIVIIGDGIKDLSHQQKNVLFIGDRVAIGDYVLGKKCNLKEIIIGNPSVQGLLDELHNDVQETSKKQNL